MLKSTDVIKNKDYPVYRNIKKIKESDLYNRW